MDKHSLCNALLITGLIIDSVHFLTEKSSHLMNWDEAAQSIKFLPNEAKYTLFLSYHFSSSPVKIRLSRRRSSVVLFVWSRRIERVGRYKLIQTNLTEKAGGEF